MAHALRRMPIPPEVHIFEGEIGGNYKLFAPARSQDGAIVADAQSQDPAFAPAHQQLIRTSSNARDQFPLGCCGLWSTAFTLTRHAASIPCVTEVLLQRVMPITLSGFDPLDSLC
jgi:hypothetical protein